MVLFSPRLSIQKVFFFPVILKKSEEGMLASSLGQRFLFKSTNSCNDSNASNDDFVKFVLAKIWL